MEVYEITIFSHNLYREIRELIGNKVNIVVNKFNLNSDEVEMFKFYTGVIHSIRQSLIDYICVIMQTYNDMDKKKYSNEVLEKIKNNDMDSVFKQLINDQLGTITEDILEQYKKKGLRK